MALLFFLVAWNLPAQTFNEWFRQKETQLKYLVEQIGALKVYGEAVKEGYAIAQNGLTNISSSKGEDLRQHRDYFSSLEKVRDGIRSLSQVERAVRLKEMIEREYRASNSGATVFLSEEERDYFRSVWSALLQESSGLSGEMEVTIKEQWFRLKDDERIARIERICLQMEDCYSFSRSISNEIRTFVWNRLREKSNSGKTRSLYGLK